MANTYILSGAREFIRLTEVAEGLRDSMYNEKAMFNLIFSQDVAGKISDLNIPFVRRPRSGSPANHVVMYVADLRKMANELQAIVDAIGGASKADLGEK
ncbi:MAG: hypothetical protein HY226_02220 [Candidatus Vogelbacteria bacterium]|nr:hypothetical protein [Candidatus Vogelbacteria bacterium]